MDSHQNTKRRILVIDDNPVNVRFLKILLEKEGFHTFSAVNGTDCIALVQREKPDLILLDIDMPGITGIDVCKALKQDPETRDPDRFSDGLYGQNGPERSLRIRRGRLCHQTRPTHRVAGQAEIGPEPERTDPKTLSEEKLRCVIEVAGAICHELNQPMMSVLGYAELLLMDLPHDYEMYPNVEKIKAQTERMGKITRKLMGITTYRTKDYMGGVSQIIDIDRAAVPG